MTFDPENNIIQLDNYRGINKSPSIAPRIVRISSELDGMEALYNSDLSQEHLFSVKILFWALLDNGQVCAIVPWLKDIVTTHRFEKSTGASAPDGQWQGYYDTHQERIFFTAPEHKSKELELAHQFYASQQPLKDLHFPPKVQSRSKSEGLESKPEHIIQELPDHLGTHAAFKHQGRKGFHLKPIISWQLTSSGTLQAMVPKTEDPDITPLPGSHELTPAELNSEFRYYFQHSIATRIKLQDPNAMTVVSLLIDLV